MTTISVSRYPGTDSERAERKRDGGKLSDQGEEVDQQQIEEREPPPPLAEALIDHRRVALACRDAQPGHHLLHKVADGQQHD